MRPKDRTPAGALVPCMPPSPQLTHPGSRRGDTPPGQVWGSGHGHGHHRRSISLLNFLRQTSKGEMATHKERVVSSAVACALAAAEAAEQGQQAHVRERDAKTGVLRK